MDNAKNVEGNSERRESAADADAATGKARAKPELITANYLDRFITMQSRIEILFDLRLETVERSNDMKHRWS